jgi:hypothetical protein
MKKLIIPAFLALAGCATTAPNQYYRAAGEQNQIILGGHYDNIIGTITITANGNDIANGSIGFFGEPAEISGTFENRTISANCNQNRSGISCLVFVDNERAATLSF